MRFFAARRFERLFLAHEEELRAFVAAVVRAPSARDDVLQEVALALWQHFPRYDDSRSSFGAWARGVARHKVFDHFRRDARRLITLSPEAVDAVSVAFDQAPENGTRAEEALAACLRGLPARASDLLQRRYTHGDSVEALAGHFGSTSAAIYQQLSRLRASLAECIRRRLDREEEMPAPVSSAAPAMPKPLSNT